MVTLVWRSFSSVRGSIRPEEKGPLHKDVFTAIYRDAEITEISLTKSFYHTYYHHLTKFTPMFWRVSEEDEICMINYR